MPNLAFEPNYQDYSEDVLVRLSRERDESAYKELMRRSRDICMRVAISCLGNREDALDEVADAFWKAYSHLSTFQQQSKFSTWAVRIVINQCLMRLRERQRLALLPYETVDSSGEEYILHEAVDPQNPETLLGGTELCTVVRDELNRIPLMLRVPLKLRHIEGLEVEEIAGRLNITVAATKSRLHRAQLYLKNRMLKHCGARGLGTLTRAA